MPFKDEESGLDLISTLSEVHLGEERWLELFKDVTDVEAMECGTGYEDETAEEFSGIVWSFFHRYYN